MKKTLTAGLARWRGLVYRLLTRGAFAKCVGSLFRENRIPKLGYSISVPASSGPEIKSSIFFGMYEFAEIKLIKKFLPPDLDCIELGASIGIVSRRILQILENGKSLIAVEAMPSLCELFWRNIGTEKPAGRVRVIQRAIAYGSNSIDFRIGAEHNEGGVAHQDGDETVRILTTSLTSIVKDLEGKPYSLVMDIEGAEYDLIKNCYEALASCQCIIAEVHGTKNDTLELIRRIQKIGFFVTANKHTVWVFLRSQKLP